MLLFLRLLFSLEFQASPRFKATVYVWVADNSYRVVRLRARRHVVDRVPLVS